MPTPRAFPFQPDGIDAVVETYGYDTDVLRARSGAEQRVRLRRHPGGGLRFRVALLTHREKLAFHSAVSAGHEQPWSVPLWTYACPLTADVTAGATSISLDTTNVPFKDPLGLGTYAMLWQDWNAYELVAILNVNASTIDLQLPVFGNWSAATARVFPVRIGRLMQEAILTHHGRYDGTAQVAFSFDAADDTDTQPAFILVGGVPMPVGP